MRSEGDCQNILLENVHCKHSCWFIALIYLQNWLPFGKIVRFTFNNWSFLFRCVDPLRNVAAAFQPRLVSTWSGWVSSCPSWASSSMPSSPWWKTMRWVLIYAGCPDDDLCCFSHFTRPSMKICLAIAGTWLASFWGSLSCLAVMFSSSTDPLRITGKHL